jgi:F1F0 ATPase subunit 2
MTWSDALWWAAATGWGLVIGGFYFYGLWWTLRKLPGKKRPGLWLGISYAVRTTLAMLGFWLAIRNGVVPFFFSVGGFFLMRGVLTRRLAGTGGTRRA